MKIFFSFILPLLIISSFLSTNLVNAEDKCSSYTNKDGFELYKQRTNCYCNKYKYNPTIVNLDDNYPEIDSKTKYSFKDIKAIHIENMNDIYKCWLITTQKKALLLIKNQLIGTPIKKKVDGKITSNIEKLNNISNSLNCTKTDSEDSVQKLILLKQATYQTCKYINYLEYLKEYNKNIPNIIKPKEWNYTPLEIVKTQKDKISELNNEIKNTYKVFPIAFHAYTEYENNITAHFLLQLIKDDYLTLREKLHKALNPINQVVYKIANAMKK